MNRSREDKMDFVPKLSMAAPITWISTYQAYPCMSAQPGMPEAQNSVTVNFFLPFAERTKELEKSKNVCASSLHKHALSPVLFIVSVEQA